MKIFVILPWRETVTVRNVSTSSSLDSVQADLELLCGLPSDTYSLWFGNCELSSLTFSPPLSSSSNTHRPKSNVDGQLTASVRPLLAEQQLSLGDGSIVRVRLKPAYNDLMRCAINYISDDNNETRDDEYLHDDHDKNYSDYFWFTAAFLVSFRGQIHTFFAIFEQRECGYHTDTNSINYLPNNYDNFVSAGIRK